MVYMIQKYRYPHRPQQISRILANNTRELIPILCLSSIQTSQIQVLLDLQLELPGLVLVDISIPEVMFLDILVTTTRFHMDFRAQQRMETMLE
jgi:hypothetical protein